MDILIEFMRAWLRESYGRQRACLLCVYALGRWAVNAAPPLDEWMIRSSGTTQTLHAVSRGAGGFVAVGAGGAIVFSRSGIYWHAIQSTTTNTLRGAAFGDNLFVAVGDNGLIATSSSGTVWTQQSVKSPIHLYGVTHGPGRFVAVGHYFADSSFPDAILTSTNGTNWTERIGDQQGLLGVTYGNGLFVAVGRQDLVMISRDGLAWTRQEAGSHNDLSGITFGDGIFVAVGNDTYTPRFPLLRSTDAVNWSSLPLGVDATVCQICHGDGTFVAVGGYLSIVNGAEFYSARVTTSEDGIVWMARPVQADGELRGVAHGETSFVAVGENGLILQSGSAGPAELEGRFREDGSGFELTLNAESGRAYRLEAAVTCPPRNWIDLGAFTNTQGVITYLDTNAVALPVRFYRAVALQN